MPDRSMKPPALGPVVYHVARHGFPTYVRQRAMALATNAHLAYVQVSSSPLVQIIAFDLAVVLLSFSCIYIVLHAAYAILEQTVLGESRKPREEKMREVDQIFKKYKYSIPEDEMDEFQKDFANFARRRGYRMNGSLLPGGQSAEDDLAIAPLASVDGDIPLLAKSFRVVETPERPITPPPLPMFAAVISPGASSFVSLSHTSPAGNLTKAPVRIQPLDRKAYTPAHTLQAITAQEGVSEPLTSRVALPGAPFAEQRLAMAATGTYELGTGLGPGETLLGTTIPPPIPPLRQPSSSAGIADEFASNAPLLPNDPLLVEGDALFGEVAPLAKAVTPVDDVADPLAEGQLSAPFVAEGLIGEPQIYIPPNASLTRMSPTADPTRDIGIEQALNLPPMADSTLSLPADSTASQTANGTASRRRAGSIATRPASGAASSRSAPGTAIAPPPASTSSISIQEVFLGLFGTDASEEGEEEHGHRVNALVAQVDGAAAAQAGTLSHESNASANQLEVPSAQASTSADRAGTTSSQNGAPSTKSDVYAAPGSDATAALEDETSASTEDDAAPTSELATPPSSSLSHTVYDSSVEGTARDERGGPSHEGAAEISSEAAAVPASEDANSFETATEPTDYKPDERSGHSLEDPIVVSPDSDTSRSIDEGDITITQDEAASLPADGRSVLPANGPRSAFDDSDEEDDGDEDEDEDEEEDEEEEEDIVNASTLHDLNGTLSPIAEDVDENEEDGPAYHDVNEQSSPARTDKEADAAHHDEKDSPAHHERVEPGVSYASAVRGDGPVWWT
ncbi:hypothetical protein EV715DRAFT_260861 [Schizophyllum commune]